MKKINICEKNQEWILLHPGEVPGMSLLKHIQGCSSCQAFWEQEKLIQAGLAKYKTMPISIPREQSLKVKQAIWETSQALSVKKQKINYFFPKVAGILTVCSILLLFFVGPIFSGENYFGFQVNQSLGQMINQHETVSLVHRGDTASTEGIKFVSQYVKTPAEKSFYYTTGTMSKETYLLISYLAKKTGIEAKQIDEWINFRGYAYMLRKLHLPYQKTVVEIQSYLDQFRKAPSIPTLTLDSYILWVDYTNDTIWIDSYPREIKLDAILMHAVHVGQYATFYLQEKDQYTVCFQIEESLFPATILSGTVEMSDLYGIKLVGNPGIIQVTSKTIFNEPIQARENSQSKDLLVRIRALLHGDLMTAVSVTPYTKGLERTVSGVLDVSYHYGFTLQGLDLSFCFEKEPATSVTNLPIGTVITVTGVDYGTYFLVSRFSVIQASQPIETHYLLAKADSVMEPRMMKQAGVVDFIIAREGDSLLLASGKKVASSVGQFPPGSKIMISASETLGKPTVSLLEVGASTLFSGNVVLLKKLENGTCLFTVEQQNKKILLLPKKGETIPKKAILQGVMIQYENISIMVDYRMFLMKDLTTTKGIITKIMEKTKLLVLDNGTLVSLDDWTVITGEGYGVGKTVQFFGILKQGTLHAYMGSVEKEMVLFKGSIVEINEKELFLRLDSGEIVFWNHQTGMQIGKEKLEKGDLIFIRASWQGEKFLAIDIWIPQQGIPDLGDNA